MVRDRSRVRKTYYWTPRFLAAFVVVIPLSLQKKDFRAAFGGGLSVATNKASPAYAAFEDLQNNYAAPPSRMPDKFETLAAGTPFRPEPVLAAAPVRSLTLKGMIVRSPAQEPQPYYVAGETTLSDRQGNMLPLPARKQIISQKLAQARSEYVEKSPAEVAKELVDQEMALPAPVSNDRKEMRSITGTPIIIAKADLRPDPVPQPDRNPIPEPTYAALPQQHKNPANDFNMSGMTSVNPVDEQMRPLWLNGQLEMTGGLAYIGAGENTLVVKRVVDGQVLEKGRIWINEGRFEIYVKTVSGQLVAELLGRDGRVLGRGQMSLVQIKEIPTKDNRIYDLRISLRPTTETASLRTVSGYSHGQQMIPVRDARVEIQDYAQPAKVNDDGFYSEPTLTHESTYVARATAPKHWSTLVVGQAQHPQDVRLFSNKLMEALIALETSNKSDLREATLKSVVWGQIQRGGKPSAGAVVEMAGSYKPIYLNEMYLPDPSLKATSANGLFAFVDVKRGVQALRVLSQGRTYPAQVFPTEDQHVSYVELDLEDRIVTQFKVIDVLNIGAQIEARIRMVGADDILSIRQQGMIEYSKGGDPFMIEAEAGPEYEISRMTLVGKPQNVHVPMIRHDWLTNLFNQQNTLALPGRGMIVGFIDDQDFEVELTGYAAKEKMQIVYFDAKGNPVQGRRNGVAGGGFVIFNAPLGLQTLYVHPLNAKETFAQVVVAEPEYVHVLTWSAGSN